MGSLVPISSEREGAAGVSTWKMGPIVALERTG